MWLAAGLGRADSHEAVRASNEACHHTALTNPGAIHSNAQASSVMERISGGHEISQPPLCHLLLEPQCLLLCVHAQHKERGMLLGVHAVHGKH